MRLTRRDFNRIVDRLEFTQYQPHEPVAEGTKPKSWDNVRFGAVRSGERWRLWLPRSWRWGEHFDRDADIRAVLAPLEGVKSMSTLANAYLIHEITKFLQDDEVYLNIGVWQGFTFFAAVLNHQATSIGVDNFSEFGGPREKFLEHFARLQHPKASFWDLDYKEYFSKKHNEQKIGFYFYDGAHDYKNQMAALTISEPHFAKNAIILVDDSNNPHARHATLDFVKERHRRYEIILDQFTAGNRHPTFHNGLMVLRAVN
jgi:Methyltransferase domain